MSAFTWIAGLLRRRTARVAVLSASVALAVALVFSLGTFITVSNARMTALAVAGVPVDWQVQLASGTSPAAARATLSSAHGVTTVREVGYADARSLTATTGAMVQTTAAAKILGLPADYAATFPGEVRFLSGGRSGVLIAQQTAANLHVVPGDRVTVALPGGGASTVRIDGVVDLPAADSLFQIVGAPPGAGATAPPDNVILLPIGMWRAMFADVARLHPESVRSQLHANLSRDLPPAPAEAYVDVVSRAHNVEARGAGTLMVGDNLAAMLDAARADAVYAELLFLLLGLPGVVLAWMLAAVAGADGRERRRHEQALLRVRGAGPSRIAAYAQAEAALVAVAGCALGLGASLLAGPVVFGTAAGSGTWQVGASWAAAAIAVGVAIAAAAIVLPALSDARTLSVRSAQGTIAGSRPALWKRLYLDLVLLAAAGLVFWQATRNAYQVVLVPEGVPSISIDYLTLLAPIALWAGAALFAWRLSDLMLERATPALTATLRPIAGRLAGVQSASMARQSRLLSRSVVLVALAVSFAVSVAVFNTTYSNQARVDAQLTAGADVAVTAGSNGLPAGLAAKVGRVAGVTAAVPMQHRLAYVGNDLQDLYGIDAARIGDATTISDAYFQGGSAAATLGKLASTPDGILVSQEAVKDFQLQPGDTVRIRLQGPDHVYHAVPFRYVGVTREFPTAPHDSFLVANAAYVAKATGVASEQVLLLKTDREPAAVAVSVRALLGPASGAVVNDVTSELKTTLSSLTAVDLTGLTRLELVFAALMAAAASGLMLALGFAERRRTFAIAHALGANGSQLASFVWSEALYVTLGGMVLGAATGALEAWMIVKILTGVFDPPPEGLFVPWLYLGLVALVIALSVLAAVGVTIRAARRPALEVIRDL